MVGLLSNFKNRIMGGWIAGTPLQTNLSIVLSSLSGDCDFLLQMLMRRVEGVEGVVSIRHWISGSEVTSFLGVREMWVSVLERKAATGVLSCPGDGGRIVVKERWEMVFQVLLLLSNRTQGSWI